MGFKCQGGLTLLARNCCSRLIVQAVALIDWGHILKCSAFPISFRGSPYYAYKGHYLSDWSYEKKSGIETQKYVLVSLIPGTFMTIVVLDYRIKFTKSSKQR